MVLKVSKRGVRSGNSLKRINNTTYQRNYRRDGIIIRKLIQTGEHIDRQNFIGDVDLRANTVPYSINKKGRWELPGVIKNKIEDGEYDDEKYAVQVVERHKLLRKSNCISVHTSQTTKGSNKETKGRSRKKGYLNAESILNPQRDRLTRRERARRLRRGMSVDDENENETEPEVTPSSVRYEVFYPPSQTSGLNYTRYAGDDLCRRDKYDFGACSSKRYCNCNSKKDCIRRNKFRDIIQEELGYLENKEIEEDMAVFGDPFIYTSENLDRSNYVSLVDFLKTSFDRKERKRTRRKSSKSDSEEGTCKSRKMIYETIAPKETTKENEVIHEKEINVRGHSPNIILVTLSNDETSPQKLREQYGNEYVECSCFPRKFIIDISEQIKDKRPPQNSKNKDMIHACVVFTWDLDNECNTSKTSIFKVVFNSTLDSYVGEHRIETLYDYMEITMAECIQRTVFYTETLPEFGDEIVKSPAPITWSPCKTRASSVARCAEWKSETYIPNKGVYYSNFMLTRKPESTNQNTDKIWHDEAGLADKFCDICYEFLGVQTSGTALQSCGHWFCDSCWAEYLESRVNSVSTTLICPEFNCVEEVDPGTVTSLLSLNNVIRYAKFYHDYEVERNEITKWCPNKNCGRVHKANSDSVKELTCNCRQTFCFDCLGEPHWPAPCDSFMDYHKKLKDTGDIGIAPVESLDQVIVNGKTCPHCKKFVEKNGGCPFMACVCGGSFCWGCGRDWNSNSHDTKCFTNGYKNDHDTTEVTVEDDKRKWNKKHKWYNIAVRQRSEQHPFKIDQMKTGKMKIAKHLSAFIGNNAIRDISIKLDFEGKRHNYANEQEKLPEYLNEMITLHQELSRVAESAAVLIDSNKLPQKYELKMQYIIFRLSSFAREISKGFLHGLEREPGELLAIFKEVRIHCMKTLKCLHETIDKIEL